MNPPVVATLKPNLRVYPDLTSLNEAVAKNIAELTTTATERFHLTLSGGNTPRTLYTLLATNFQDKIPWHSVHLFWSDERYVPQTDPISNYRMVRQALLDHIRVTPSNIHPIPTDFPDPNQAAKAYEAILRTYFQTPWPTFSLVLLGLGIDGHTASLFPDSAALEERKRWVIPTSSPTEPHLRITLTLPALTHAKQIYFIVAGVDKADAVQKTLTEDSQTPASQLLTQRPDAVLWTDEAAARHVRHASIL